MRPLLPRGDSPGLLPPLPAPLAGAWARAKASSADGIGVGRWVLPRRVAGAIALLALLNAAAWAVSAAAVLSREPALASPAVLAYTLGLRHALDADHISAIDLMTRRLVASGQRPVSVGAFFSLGHSTVVLATCVVVAATSGALRDRFDGFARVGGIVGTAVSAAFLTAMCLGNAWVLWRLVRRLRSVLREEAEAEAGGARQHGGGSHDGDSDSNEDADGGGGGAGLKLEGPGLMAGVFRRPFRIVDRPWKMYPLGVLFGLGFDTSSEIAVLGIASVQGAQGTSLWVILIFPVLFTGELSPQDI